MDALALALTLVTGSPVLALFALIPLVMAVGAVWTRRETVRAELNADARRRHLAPGHRH